MTADYLPVVIVLLVAVVVIDALIAIRGAQYGGERPYRR